MASAISTTNEAFAYASLAASAIYQNADATAGGDATANFNNGGAITLSLTHMRAVRGLGHCQGFRSNSQTADAASGRDASANITNSGDLSISALARRRSGPVNAANAYATIDMGINLKKLPPRATVWAQRRWIIAVR